MITDQNPDKVRHVSAPLAIDSIKEYFSDKELFFIVDYATSKIKDKVLLTYLANLNIPCDIEFTEDVTKEEIKKLIVSYMSVKSINRIASLTSVVAAILLRAKGDRFEEVSHLQTLSLSDIDEFIVENKELVERWLTFLESAMYYVIYTVNSLNEQVKVEESLPVIDDPNYIGLNVVNLFSLPSFYEHFVSLVPITQDYWFKQQFEEHIFKGSKLLAYMDTEANPFFAILLGLIDGELPLDPTELLDEETMEDTDNG